MARATSKPDLLDAAQQNYEKLQLLIDGLSEKELNTEFDFSDQPKKKEAHWGRDRNLRDVLIHLYEWHQLLLSWVSNNQKGNPQSFLPALYNWRTYGKMNVDFFNKHQETSLEKAKQLLSTSHYEVISMIETLSNEALFSKNYFKWASGSTIGSYCVSATASHYAWAMKKLKAHKSNLKKK